LGQGDFRKYKELLKPFKLVSFLDNDDEGLKRGNEMIESGLNVQVYKWNGNRVSKYDINQFIQDNKGTTLKDILGQVETYKGGKDNTPETIVEGFFADEINKFYDDSQKLKMGETKGFLLNHFPLLEKGIDGVQSGLWLIAGNTNIGKTSFLVNLSLDLLKSNDEMKVLFFSIDDSIGTIIKRIVSNLGEMRIEETYKRSDDKDKESRKLIVRDTLLEWDRGNRLKIIDVKYAESIDKLKDFCIKNKADKMAIIIDGVNYLSCGKKEGLERDIYISTEIKNLSSVLDCPIITTCESRKSSDTKDLSPEKLSTREISVEDIKGSTTIGYKADLITSISLVNPAEWEKDDAEFRVLISKNKWGSGKGRIDMMFYKQLSKITEIGWAVKKKKSKVNKTDKTDNDEGSILSGVYND
jgi:KaiC/GvpD/RAD55 family RecA-like ATPase